VTGNLEGEEPENPVSSRRQPYAGSGKGDRPSFERFSAASDWGRRLAKEVRPVIWTIVGVLLIIVLLAWLL
jgi:hypothetical protein